MSEPYCLAMVLCDDVYIDPATGKKTILGTFSTANAVDYPTSLRFCVYYAITDAEGDLEINFRIVDSKHLFEDEVEPVFACSFEFPAQSPLVVYEHIIRTTVQLPDSGVYHCELLCRDDLLMSRRLVALRLSDLESQK